MSDAAHETTDETTPDDAPETTPDSAPDSAPESSADPSQEVDHAADHGPLERAEEAIDEAKSASAHVEQSGGTFGGDVTEDLSTPGAGDDQDAGVESAPEGTSDAH